MLMADPLSHFDVRFTRARGEHERSQSLVKLLARAERRKRAYTRSMKKRVRELKKSYDRGFTYTIGGSDGVMSPFPEDWLLTILKRHRGKRVRVVAYNNTPGEEVRRVGALYGHPMRAVIGNVDQARLTTVRRGVMHRGLVNGAVKTGDHVYSVPDGTNKVINRWYRDTSAAIPWLLTYDTSSNIDPGQPEPLVTEGDIIRVFVAENIVSSPVRIQYFAQGVSHCLIQPIINDLEHKRNALKSASKQSLSNYNCALKKLESYAEKYAGGIPVAALHTMVEDVSMCGKQINIDIKVPCAKKGDSQFIKIDNQYGHGVRYEFVNWRFDHVDALASTYKDHKNATELSRDALKEMLRELTQSDKFCEWSCDSLGPVSICTQTETFRCHVQFGERYTKFCEQFAGYRIDHITDSMMSKFVLEGVHYCVAASFNDITSSSDLRCYDMKKSYANFHESRFYEQCQFPSKLTDLYPVSKVMGPGYYRIVNLKFDHANAKFAEICSLYGDPFQDDNVYALPLLMLLDDFGVKYDIVMGCWAGGSQNTFDFRFTDELIDSKEYALIVGKWNHLKYEDVTCIKGTKEFASHLKSTSTNCDAFWFPRCENDSWASEDGTIQIKYPRQHVWHLSQFTGYINAYEFIKMTDQLMEVDLTKVIQIQKDDFLCEYHTFPLMPYMGDKTHELYATNDADVSKLDRKLEWNSGAGDDHREMPKPSYLSGIWQTANEADGPNPVFAEIESACNVHAQRFAHIDINKILPHSVISLDGPGGTGKTDFVLRNKLLQRTVYIAQSHKLCRAKADEYKLAFGGECQLAELERELHDVKWCKKQRLSVRNEPRLQVTVWARAFHESPEIWSLIHRYANTLVIDEVSMMHNESVEFLMQRFAEHKIFLCGDPGMQLAAYKSNSDTCDVKTPFNAQKLKIPSYTFTKIFRVKCERLLSIRLEGRQMLERGTTTVSHLDYRAENGQTRFPLDWGSQRETKKPGPVAGLTFYEAAENEWYVSNVAMRCESNRGLMHRFRRFVDREYHETQPVSVEEIEAFYIDKFTTVDTMEQVADMYQAHQCVELNTTPQNPSDSGGEEDAASPGSGAPPPVADHLCSTHPLWLRAAGKVAEAEAALSLAVKGVAKPRSPVETAGEARRLPKDMIICSTNEFADEWTAYLTPLQPKVAVTSRNVMKEGSMFKYFDGASDERANVARRLNHAYARYLNASERESASGAAYTQYRRDVELEKSIKKPDSTTVTRTEDVPLQKWNDDSTTHMREPEEMRVSCHAYDVNNPDKAARRAHAMRLYEKWNEYIEARDLSYKWSDKGTMTGAERQKDFEKWNITLLRAIEVTKARLANAQNEQVQSERKRESSPSVDEPAPMRQKASDAAYKQYRHYVELEKSIKKPALTTVTRTEELQLQKWKVDSTTRDFSNGEVVISASPPTDKCHLSHAFTAHSTIGETARGKVFIDRRNMFEIEHWETIIGRATRWEDIVIVNLPDPDPSTKYAQTKIYSLSSKKGNCCYIGHTTLPTVEARAKQHLADFKSNTRQNKCTSRLVMKHNDWIVDLIEEFPCASKRQAESRENYHIQQQNNAVNKTMPAQQSLPQIAPQRQKNAPEHIANLPPCALSVQPTPPAPAHSFTVTSMYYSIMPGGLDMSWISGVKSFPTIYGTY